MEEIRREKKDSKQNKRENKIKESEKLSKEKLDKK